MPGSSLTIVRSALIASILALLAAPGGAWGQDQAAAPVELVSRVSLDGHVAGGSIWSYRGFVYIGAADPDTPRAAAETEQPAPQLAECKGAGVAVVDLADPKTPYYLGTVARRDAALAQSVQVVAEDTAGFRGDILVAGLTPCGAAGKAGLTLWDVTDPRHARELGFFETGPESRGVDDVTLIRRPNALYALVAQRLKTADGPGVLEAVLAIDLTSPQSPVELSRWVAPPPTATPPADPPASERVVPLRLWATPDGETILVSIGSRGMAMLDVVDVGQIKTRVAPAEQPAEQPRTPEGTVATALVKGARILVEVKRTTPSPAATVTWGTKEAPSSVSAQFPGATRRVAWPVTAAVAEVAGAACQPPERAAAAGPTEDAAPPYLIVPNWAACKPEPLLELLNTRRASGFLIVADPSALEASSTESPIVSQLPMLFLDERRAGPLVMASLSNTPPMVQVDLSGDLIVPPGSIVVSDISSAHRPIQLASLRLAPRPAANTRGPQVPPDRIAAQGDRVYAAWRGEGLRILDLADPTQPREVGSFVPPAPDNAQPAPVADIRGVYPRGDLLLVTDARQGLFTLRDISR
ncbi:MAG: hypothetical protein U0821_03180 [Chloroflexota bacterium]